VGEKVVDQGKSDKGYITSKSHLLLCFQYNWSIGLQS